jgi:LysM repeat protein
MRKITLLAISFFCLLHAATAQYFIQYDPSCMDKLEYRMDDGADGKTFIAFRLNKSATEKYFFQIGLDNLLTPSKTVHPIACKDAFLDEDAMNAINDAKKNAYVVVNTPKGTRLYQIGSISYVVTGENLLSFVGDQYTFASDLLTPYENLAAQDSHSQVYFIGTETLHGKTVYHFRVEPLQGSSSVISRTFRYAPHIGIVSETVPDNGTERQIDLKLVNGKSLEDYFASVDDKLPIVILHDAPETVAETTTTSNKSAHTSTRSAESSSTTSKIKVRQANEDGTYEIKAGDNLYSVSRSFGITLGQLRAWNNLVSDDILPGSKLLVQAPPKIKPTEALNMKGSFYEIDPGSAVTIPDEYEAKMKQKKAAAARLKSKGGETMTQKSEEVKARAVVAKGGADAQVPLFVKREKDSGLHIVQKGETIASMAKKYKVTEAKFRRLNGMNADETVRTGQVLKISECVCEDDKPAAGNTPAPYSNHSKKLSSKGGNEESVVMVHGKRCHIAKDGETLYSISRKHGLSVEKLREYNRMANSDLVAPKQKLFLE